MTEPVLNIGMPWDSSTIAGIISKFQENYPFLSVKPIGKSVLGKPLFELRIGKGIKKVHMNASFHANEWITSMVLMKLLHQYLEGIRNDTVIKGYDVREIYEQVDLSIVPMVNPDGVDLVLGGPPSDLRDELIEMNRGSEEFVHWKANIRGVDLNKQFPANWDVLKRKEGQPDSPGPRDFPGECPLSEPEAIAMAGLAAANHFDRLIAFHTQGKEFYWGYGGNEPADTQSVAKVFEQLSGYRAIRYVDSHAGYKDWYIQEFKRQGFTLELGWGINPLPLSQFTSIFNDVEPLFFAALYL